MGLKMALYAHVSGLVENISYLYARAQSRAALTGPKSRQRLLT